MEDLLLPPPPGRHFTIQPRDFALVRGFVDPSTNRYTLHLFYIRHSYYNIPADANERNIGHAWTTDFNGWYGPAGLNQPDTVALTARAGKFDELHVWAPTIVQRGSMFYMFYTGVRSDVQGGPQHQRIGVATSADLVTWTPSDDPVLTAPQIPWVKKDPSGAPYLGAQQLRDPFVMEDPTSSGTWLMFFVAEDSINAPKMAVGVARSTDLIAWAPLEKPISSTERPTFQGPTTIVESPHVFRRNGQWWLLYTVNGGQIFFETTTSTDPTDTVAVHWTNPVQLQAVTEGRPPELQYWHASEYLRIGSTEYLAAWDTNDTSIDIAGMFTPANAALDSVRLSCPQITGVDDPRGSGGEVRMSISRHRWGDPEVGLRLELPARLLVRLAVYDIAGRRRTTLLDRELPDGVTDVTWDGRDASGIRVASGIYYVRLMHPTGAVVSRVVMIQ